MCLKFFADFTCRHLINHSYFNHLFWSRFRTQRDGNCFFFDRNNWFLLNCLKILIKFLSRIPLIFDTEFLACKKKTIIRKCRRLCEIMDVISQCWKYNVVFHPLKSLAKVCLRFYFVWRQCIHLQYNLNPTKMRGWEDELVLSRISYLDYGCVFRDKGKNRAILQEIQICNVDLPAASVPRAVKDNSTRKTRASVIAFFSHNNTMILKLKHVRP